MLNVLICLSRFSDFKYKIIRSLATAFDMASHPASDICGGSGISLITVACVCDSATSSLITVACSSMLEIAACVWFLNKRLRLQDELITSEAVKIPETRSIATQSQVTYTSLRSVRYARFDALSASEQGAFHIVGDDENFASLPVHDPKGRYNTLPRSLRQRRGLETTSIPEHAPRPQSRAQSTQDISVAGELSQHELQVREDLWASLSPSEYRDEGLHAPDSNDDVWLSHVPDSDDEMTPYIGAVA